MSRFQIIKSMSKNILKKGGSIFHTVPAPNAKSLTQIGIPKIIKQVGTGTAAVAIGAYGTRFTLSQIGRGLEEIGLKDPSYADSLNDMTDAMKKRNDLLKDMLKDNPTYYGKGTPYGTPDLYGRDALIRGLGPDFAAIPPAGTDGDKDTGIAWWKIALGAGLVVGGFYLARKLKK